MRAIILLLFLAFGEIPRYQGPDLHRIGQPRWCQNFDNSEGKKNCNCMAMKARGESCKHPGEYGPDSRGWDDYNTFGRPRCSTACTKKACECCSDCAN
jgi:hypothetical protein